jgi:hypothetical protein
VASEKQRVLDPCMEAGPTGTALMGSKAQAEAGPGKRLSMGDASGWASALGFFDLCLFSLANLSVWKAFHFDGKLLPVWRW